MSPTWPTYPQPVPVRTVTFGPITAVVPVVDTTPALTSELNVPLLDRGPFKMDLAVPTECLSSAASERRGDGAVRVGLKGAGTPEANEVPFVIANWPLLTIVWAARLTPLSVPPVAKSVSLAHSKRSDP